MAETVFGRPDWFYEPTPEDMAEVNPAHLEVIRYMHRVEDHTASYVIFSQLNPELQENPEYQLDVLKWQVEEWWHAQQLHRVITHLDPNTLSRAADRQRQLAEHDRIGRFTRPVIAAGMPIIAGRETATATVATRGVINELATRSGYLMLQEIAKIDWLRRPLGHIAGQEKGHAEGIYLPRATEALDGSRSTQRKARFIIEHAAKGIVGQEYQGDTKARFVVKTLFSSKRADEHIEETDDVISALPGMQGFRPMRRSVDQALAA